MSYSITFLNYYPFFCVALFIGAIVAVLLSDKLCNTDSLNKHWVIVGLITSCLIGLRDYKLSLLVLAMVVAAIVVSYLRKAKKKSVQIIEQQPDFVKRIK
ncbi:MULTISPECIES: hypothetical protein [Acinetobacter]|uniref:hypothetical protein n=1 Tax=Acinetobacter TaxID=469 RepID=UPI001F06C5D9|nr:MULTISPECIES: hypothetical protein [Acinetobacter]MCH2003691.1 hypothetical protein [Acinetobacter seifertii]WQF74972.1 hypothetical protein OKW95_19745 [Acinetobacter oleivorans]